MTRLRNVVGLDLGQSQDFSALAMLEWAPPPPAVRAAPVYDLRTLHRWPLGTPYTEIARSLADYLAAAAMRKPVLVVDETGVGRPVVEMVLRELLARKAAFGLTAVTITAGHAPTLAGPGVWHVPKKTLVASVQVLLQTRRLRVPRGLPLSETLVRELESFRVKVTVAGNETFEALRERDHDDLVLAVALAAWAAESLAWDSFDPPPPRPRPHTPPW